MRRRQMIATLIDVKGWLGDNAEQPTTDRSVELGTAIEELAGVVHDEASEVSTDCLSMFLESTPGPRKAGLIHPGEGADTSVLGAWSEWRPVEAVFAMLANGCAQLREKGQLVRRFLEAKK
ncbi:hypothetical protein DL769_006315 [Monosporascus sp. CRB-8-3]|nr:hypothetical protein DL769_006315 [Monosporascus sp. CRB-8-3]